MDRWVADELYVIGGKTHVTAATVICYRRLPNDKREREVERLEYPSVGSAEKAASGLTTLDHYDTIEVEDAMGFIRCTFKKHDRSDGMYQKGF